MSFLFNADELFEIAIDIEENGKKFYDQAAAKSDDARVKDLFGFSVHCIILYRNID